MPMWMPCGFQEDSKWISCGTHVFYINVNHIWTPSAHHVDSMWSPVEHMSIRYHVDSIATAAVASARVSGCDRDNACESEQKRMHEYGRE